jgi:4-hydroxy-L-threonine phosphate dehydrogenase PdxA
MKPILGILLGDATGIGAEITAKVCAKSEILAYCNPIIIGDLRVLKAGMKISGADFSFNVVDDISQANWKDCIPLLDLKNIDPADIKMGQIDAKSGKATGELFETALELFNNGEIHGFTFAPYNKAALEYGGFDIFKLFARNLRVSWPFGELNTVNNVWISRVTSHIPLKDVSKRLTIKSIAGAIKLVNDTMILTGIDQPRIAVAALNPHAGEDGLFGQEEIEIIIPAIDKANEEGIDAKGPFPADTLFLNAFNGLYNGITTMYHDQGQIALKLVNFESAVTVIAGLSCPITTPAHGTAFDIVGRGVANPIAMQNAIKIAAEMANHMSKNI